MATRAFDQHSDWELIQFTASGDADAMGVLVGRYERLLRCLILRRAAYLLDYADLQEIIDETWYQVLRRTLAGDIREDIRFSSWLVGLCLNVLKQRELRPSGASLTTTGTDGEDSLIDPPGDTERPDEVAARSELLSALRDCLTDRSEVERHVYELIYVQQMTNVSAAREIGCAESYVRQKLLPRLHQALVRCLARKGFRDVSAADVI